ncbi:MAG: MFS transporter [Bacillota bacterium]
MPEINQPMSQTALISEADEATTSGARAARRSAVFWLTSGHFLVDFYTNLLPPLIPLIASDLGFSLTAGSAIVSAATITSSLSQPVFGYFIDRMAGGALLIPAVVWATMWISAVGLTHNYWLIMALAIIGGLGSALYHPLGSVTIGGLSHRRRGWNMSLYSTGGSLGYALSPLLIIPLEARYGTGALVWMFPLGLAAAIFMRRAGVNRLRAKPRQSGAAGLAGVWQAVRERLSTLVWLNLIVGVRAWASYSVTFLIPLFYLRHGYTKAMVSLPLFIYLLVSTAGSIVGGYFSDRYGRRNTIIASSLLAAALFALFLRSGSGYSSWAVLALGGAAFQAAFPVSIVFAQELFPRSAGMASGMMMGLAWGVGGLGLAVTTYISEHFGLVQALVASPVLLIVAAVLCLFLPSERGLTRGLAGH